MKYVEPEMDILRFVMSDICTVSGDGDSDGTIEDSTKLPTTVW